MRLSRGERRAAWCVLPVVVAFLPPVTTWAAGVRARPFGVPFLVFWNTLAILLTAAMGTLALRIQERIDGRDDR